MKTFSYLEVLYSITGQIRREYLTAGMTKICLVDIYKIPRSGSVQILFFTLERVKTPTSKIKGLWHLS